LQSVWGEEALNLSSVSEWFKRFKEGREFIQDDQEADVLQPLEMQTKSQMSVTW
jgi:hypothetical protein